MTRITPHPFPCTARGVAASHRAPPATPVTAKRSFARHITMPKKFHLTEEKTRRLIEEVKKRRCIWDIEHENYNDKYTVAKSWDEIGANLETAELYLRTKWKTLRDTYRKEVKKLNGDKYTGSWHHFDDLRFLVFKSEVNEAENEVTQKEQRDSSSEYEIHFESLGQSEEVFWGEEDPIQENNLEEDYDFDVMFLKSLTPYMRQLGPMRRLVVRSKIQDMLLSELAAQNASKRREMNGN